MPSPAAVYQVYSAGADTSNLVTPVLSPTPVNGDVIVVKMTTWDTGNGMGAVSGGAQTYNVVNTAAPGGFNGWSQIVTCTVAGSPGAYQITGTGSAGPSRHSMIVEHYLASQGAFLAGSPATNAVVTGAVSAPSAAIVTVGTNSVLTWCSTDVASVDPSGRAYLLSATEDGIFNGFIGSNSIQYFAYATVGAPGPYNIGMSAPNTQRWVMTGAEVQFLAPAGGNPVLVASRRKPRRARRSPIIVAGIGAPPPPPAPADVEWCAQTPITGWTAQTPFTDWDADTPLTNWMSIAPQEDC